ncbi:hypothetical protein [Geodermatophilus sp. URMC 64]
MTTATLTPAVRQRSRALPAPRPVPWGTVTTLAVLLAAADGFVLTAVQGAVGAIERSQGPFVSWLQTTAFTLPIFFAVVLGAHTIARRRFGPALHSLRTVVPAALLIAAAAALVGTAEVGISAAMDYRFQSELLQVQHANHTTGDGGAVTHIDPVQAAQQSLETDLLGARIGAGLDLAANVVLVGWVAALRGGRLGAAPRRRDTAG